MIARADALHRRALTISKASDRRQPARERRGGEERNAGRNNLAPAEQVAARPPSRRKPPKVIAHADHHPLEVRPARSSGRADRRQCHVDDRDVEDRHQECRAANGRAFQRFGSRRPAALASGLLLRPTAASTEPLRARARPRRPTRREHPRTPRSARRGSRRSLRLGPVVLLTVDLAVERGDDHAVVVVGVDLVRPDVERAAAPRRHRAEEPENLFLAVRCERTAPRPSRPSRAM